MLASQTSELVSSWFRERPCLRNKVESHQGIHLALTALHMYIYAQVHPPNTKLAFLASCFSLKTILAFIQSFFFFLSTDNDQGSNPSTCRTHGASLAVVCGTSYPQWKHLLGTSEGAHLSGQASLRPKVSIRVTSSTKNKIKTCFRNNVGLFLKNLKA